MRILGVLTLGTLFAAALPLSLGACSSASEAPPRETPNAASGGGGGPTNPVGGTSDAATTSPTAGNNNDNNNAGNLTIGSVTTTTGGDACQQLEVSFVPQVPTVFILVDRSTSMWDNHFWDPLRDGVLEVVSRVHQDVRLGFGTFTGAGNTCPLDLQEVGVIDKNNLAAIEAFYTPIAHPGVATETPTPAALVKAQELLKADNAAFPGPKFILLVTDGNPDYCDSGAVECRADVTVRILQDLAADTAVPIRTFVVALPDPGIDQQWLTAFANAGAGQPVSAPRDTEFCDDIIPATAALFPTLDPTIWPQGTYGSAMGTATPYNVDPAQQDQLVTEITGLLNGVKSCIFDLTNAAGEEVISIAEGKEAEGTVYLKTAANSDPGEAQSYDGAGLNGWKVNRIEGAADQIELVGAACDLLRSPETTGIEFGFPCEIIIEVPK